jgi:hypothetical protein
MLESATLGSSLINNLWIKGGTIPAEGVNDGTSSFNLCNITGGDIVASSLYVAPGSVRGRAGATRVYHSDLLRSITSESGSRLGIGSGHSESGDSAVDGRGP